MTGRKIHCVDRQRSRHETGLAFVLAAVEVALEDGHVRTQDLDSPALA